VPWGEGGSTARELARRCEAFIRDKWIELTDAVRRELKEKLSAQFPLWDARWEEQVTSFFEVRTAVLPELECNEEAIAKLFGKKSFDDAQPDAAKVRGLADSLPSDDRPPGYDQKSCGRWEARRNQCAAAGCRLPGCPWMRKRESEKEPQTSRQGGTEVCATLA
jgi:hypothetical protein